MTLTPTTPTPAAAPQRVEPSAISRTPGAVVALAWRTRWHTAPLTVGGFVCLVGYATPGVVALVMAVVGGLAYRAARHPHDRKRMYLSVRERDSLALWGAGCAVWALAVFAVRPEWHWHEFLWSAAGLALLTAWPAVRWVGSRKIRVRRHDRATRDHVKRWDSVGRRAPLPLQGSHVIKASIKSPAPGATVFDVQLADDVHAANAVTEECRRAVEVRYRQGAGTVTLSMVRNDVTIIRVTISPARHLEGVDVPWTPGLVHDDGRFHLAATPSGDFGTILLHDKDGVMHGWISGPSGSGKTETLVAWICALLLRGYTIVYLDGGEGTSLPGWLAEYIEWIATTPEQHRAAIDAVDAIVKARARRRGIGATRWQVGLEPDPEIAIVADEATLIDRGLRPSHREKFADFGRIGRKLGVSSLQTTQDPLASSLIGGSDARANYSQVVAHRPMRSQNARIATDGGDREVDLMTLPGDPGWVATISRGRVTFPAKVCRALQKVAVAALAKRRSRGISDADRAAAGDLWRPGEVIEPEPLPETEAEQVDSRARLVKLLQAHGPSTVGQIAPDDGHDCEFADCPGWVVKRRQTSKHLLALQVEGLVSQEGTSWFAV